MDKRKLTAQSAVDLQVHTTNSDGVWTPSELLDYVEAQGFSLVAITDHDRVDTVADVARLSARRPVHVLPAVEMTCVWEDQALDILCFGLEPTRRASKLARIAERTIQGHLDNFRQVYSTLQTLGCSFPRAAQVLAHSGGEVRSLDDLKNVMVEHGYRENMGRLVRKAGYRWVGAEIPDVVDAAHADGAVALIAHPGRGDGFYRFQEADLDRLMSIAPLDGLEIMHPSHTPEMVELYRGYAEKHGLLVSTGSDSHGKPEQLPIKYPAYISKALLERCGKRVE
jgi:3',5'-nucleoside bisphosphate phosphatase